MAWWITWIALAAAAGCAHTYERGEDLYRQGDLRGALDIWNGITPRDRNYERIKGRADLVRSELDRSFRLYQKRGRYYEDEGRSAEALLYYRLALKLDPPQTQLMDRVQGLVRDLTQRKAQEREQLRAALGRAELLPASQHADALEKLDPFDPGIQIEVRDVRAALGAELLRHVEAGKALYASGAREPAAEEFQAALALDHDNEEALGYLYYIRSLDGSASEPDDATDAVEASVEIAAPSAIPAIAATAEPAPAALAPVPAPRPPPVTQEDILAAGHFRSATQAEHEGDVYWAIQQYEAAIRVKQRYPAAKRRLAALRARMMPQVESLDEQGKRFFREEDVQNALVMWRRVLLIDPGRERTRRNVADAEKILSRLEEIQGGG